MKLVEALEIANAPQSGAPFRVLVCCGFTSLHLETALKARLRLALPDRTVSLQGGIYGDVCGPLEACDGACNAVAVVLEWADIDPRLGWRGMGPLDDSLTSDAAARLARLQAAITPLATKTTVVVALPLLAQAPIFHTVPGELHPLQARLYELLYRFAAETAATVVHPAALPPVSHDLRTELLNGMPYPFAGFDSLAERLTRALLPAPPKKGLITDLDETLWSGILGDDGLDGISWDLDHKTQYHALYQQLLNSLAETGALLAVASKNDAALVGQALQRADLLIKPENLFPIEAHWQPKVESVERILTAWNIGADSVVFVDDNALEIEQVQAAFPAIECIQFRKDDAALLGRLRELFGKRTVREEDRLRVASLRDAQAIRQAEAGGATLDTLLEGAQAKLTFRWLHQAGDPRALELVNKTNQFNLNGRRFDSAEWNHLLDGAGRHLIVVEYADRFGKLGKIAVLAGSEELGGFRLAVWVMSCRAFSRRIEQQCLKLLLDRWPAIQLDFSATERNGPLQGFLEQIGAAGGRLDAKDFAARCPRLFHQTEILYE